MNKTWPFYIYNAACNLTEKKKKNTRTHKSNGEIRVYELPYD